MGFLGLMGLLSYGSLGSPGPSGSVGSHVFYGSLKIIEIYYFRIFVIEMALPVGNGGRRQCCEGLRL